MPTSWPRGSSPEASRDRIFALASVVVLGTTLAVPSFAAGGKHWVATWATSPATFFVYTAPVLPVYLRWTPIVRQPEPVVKV